jgi:hypothetical protein
MPQDIPDTDFNLNNEVANVKFGREFRADRHLEKLEDLGQGFNLYRTERYFMVFYKDEPKLYYVMRYAVKRIPMINEEAATQIMVWTLKIPVRSAAKRVFYDHLLPERHVIATDQQQTADGARFWGNRVGEALDKNLWIYYLDTLSSPRKMIRITEIKQLGDLSPKIWGDDVKYRNQRVVISDHQLKAKNGVEVED